MVAARIAGQLVLQSQPDIEQFLIDELSAAIATELDRVVLNGSGVSPQPMEILALTPNATGQYNYAQRSPDVTFGGPASWLSILKFEDTIENAQVHNLDETYGWVGANDVKVKWMGVPQLTGYPRYLWEQGDDPFFGRVAGRRAVATANCQVEK